jgi:hypothetical protein
MARVRFFSRAAVSLLAVAAGSSLAAAGEAFSEGARAALE